MQVSRRLRPALLVIFVVASPLAHAGSSYVDFLNALAKRESGLNKRADNNQTHYVGLFQMGEAALKDLGIYGNDNTKTNDWTGTWSGKYGATSKETFLNSPEVQLAVITAYESRVWNSYLKSNGSAAYVGQTINGILITESGLIAAAHLVGPGAVAAWLKSGGTTSPKDGMGTLMTEYLRKFGGYDVDFKTPTYAELLAANPTGGTTVSSDSTGSTGGSSGGGSQSGTGTIYATAGDGFIGGSGTNMGAVRDLIVKAIASLVLAWMAYVSLVNYTAFTNGKSTLFKLKAIVLRGFVLGLLVFVVIR